MGASAAGPEFPAAAAAARRRGWQRWLRAAGLIALVAVLVVAAVYRITPHVRDLTPAALEERMALAGSGAPDGPSFAQGGLPVEKAIEQVNRLDSDARRELLRRPAAQRYFERLAPDDRLRFVRETLDRGIQIELDKFRSLSRSDRARRVELLKARQAEMREELARAPEERRARMREFMRSSRFEEVLDRAVREYLALTTSEERAELAPLFDGTLELLQYMREQ